MLTVPEVMNIPPANPLAGPISQEEASPQAEERALLQRARAGDPEAFDSLVRQHQERIYGLVYHMTANHEDAHDLVQDVFLKAWKGLRQFKGDASFYTWVYRIAVNHTLNFLKQRRNRTPHLSLNDLDLHAEHDPELVQLVSHHTPRREAGLHELARGLNEALQKLSDDHRMVVTLHDIQGLPHDEIAGILRCHPGTVRSRLFYARQQLQALLSPYLK